MVAKNSSELTWQKPTGEETPTRHGKCIYSQGELSQIRNIIKAHLSFQWRITITYATLGREKTGETQRDPKGARSTRIEGIYKIIETSWLASIPSLLFSL